MIRSFLVRRLGASLLLFALMGIGLEAVPRSTLQAAPPEEFSGLSDYVERNCDFAAHAWCRLETANNFKDVWPQRPPPGVHGVQGPSAVIVDWNGWADDGRGCFYLHGGGHTGYGGNEVYRFCSSDLAWERLTVPAPLTGPPAVDGDGDGANDRCPLPARGPPSMHTYDGLLFHPHTRKLYVWGSVPFCSNATGRGHTGWRFDPDTLRWERLDMSSGGWPATGLTATGRIVVLPGGGRKRARIYDPETDAVVAEGDRSGWIWQGNGEVVGDRFFAVQNNHIAVVDANTAKRFAVKLDRVWGTHGFAYHPTHDVFVIWQGGRHTYTVNREDILNKEPALVVYPNPNGPAPSGHKNILSKWTYLPSLDVFIGGSTKDGELWVYRLPERPQADPRKPELENQGYTCADFVFGWQCPSLQQALRNPGADGVVSLSKGVYRQCAVIDRAVTLEGNGSHLSSRACGRKAALIANADVTIRNLECSGIRVPDGNGACVRQQASRLRLENVHFHDAQQGVLAGPKARALVIEDSVLERLGGDCRARCGRAHGIYFSSGAPGSRLIIRRSRILASKDQGHEVKSGAERLLIEDSVIDSQTGHDSRLIDAFNGGELIVRRSALREGSDSVNRDLIGYAYEMRGDEPFAVNRIEIVDTSITCNGGILFGHRHASDPRGRIFYDARRTLENVETDGTCR